MPGRPGGTGELDFPAESLDVLEPPAGLLRTIGGQIRRLGRGHTFVVAGIWVRVAMDDPRGPFLRTKGGQLSGEGTEADRCLDGDDPDTKPHPGHRAT
jgi:hypothetical protein